MLKAGKSKLLIVPVVFIGFLTSVMHADVDISGFVDVIYQDVQKENSSFGMGAFEIDFETEISESAVFEGAVVVEEDGAAPGQTLVDFSILKEKIGLQAGLIDIPFGIDCLTFAACDRKLVSSPLTTELMMDGGWGDVGINFHGKDSMLNYNLFVVNGMGVDVDASSAPVNQMTDNNNSKSYGGRIGVSPAERIEVGFSYARGPYLDDNSEKLWQRSGADIRFCAGEFKLQGEYISGKEDLPGRGENKHSGFYVQVLAGIFKNVYGVLRLGQWKPDAGDAVKRTTIAAGYGLDENTSLRCEYIMNNKAPEADNNVLSLQAVVSF
ncbi:MAG: hypothetical protein ABIH68_04750 [bacterium]